MEHEHIISRHFLENLSMRQGRNPPILLKNRRGRNGRTDPTTDQGKFDLTIKAVDRPQQIAEPFRLAKQSYEKDSQFPLAGTRDGFELVEHCHKE